MIGSPRLWGRRHHSVLDEEESVRIVALAERHRRLGLTVFAAHDQRYLHTNPSRVSAQRADGRDQDSRALPSVTRRHSASTQGGLMRGAKMRPRDAGVSRGISNVE